VTAPVGNAAPPRARARVRRGASLERIAFGTVDYPEALRARLGPSAPGLIQVIGDPGLLRIPLTAWFSSGRLPADLVIPALEMARAMRDEGVAVASGFHSAVERECLELLVRGSQPVLVCPARTLAGARLPSDRRRAVEEGRMLIVSTQDDAVRRPSARSAEARNRVVAALAERVFIAGAVPGGRLHALAREVASRGQPLSCFDHPANRDLLLLGGAGVACDR
jgi:predicted Rossmann fold nucleotide-binding protein DprA/Smf involved in DNA uptake